MKTLKQQFEEQFIAFNQMHNPYYRKDLIPYAIKAVKEWLQEHFNAETVNDLDFYTIQQLIEEIEQ